MKPLSICTLMLAALVAAGPAAANNGRSGPVRTGGEMSLAAEQNTATMTAVALSGALDVVERKISERRQRLLELQQRVRDLPGHRIDVRCCR